MLGRPPLGPQTECETCGKPRTRWIKASRGLVPACTVCYNRENYEPNRRVVLKRKVEPEYDADIAKRAAIMLRKGTPWNFVCEKTGVPKRTLTDWMGRLAATESY